MIAADIKTIRQRLRTGAPQAAAAMLLEQSWAAIDGEAGIRCCRATAKALTETDPALAQRVLRRALAADPGHAAVRFAIQNLIADSQLPGRSPLRATLADVAPALAAADSPVTLGRSLFVAALPRSASTYATKLFALLTGDPTTTFRFAAEGHHQDLNLPSVVRHAASDVVVQQHCPPSEANIQIAQAFDFRVVVLVRDIFDLLLSNAEWYLRGGYRGWGRDGWQQVDPEDVPDAVIDRLGPWCVEFYAGWARAIAAERVRAVVLTWADVVEQPRSALQAVAALAGLPMPDDDQIAALVEAAGTSPQKTRLEHGIAGRGGAELSAAQKQRIRDLARSYPDVDLTPLGLPR